MINCKSRKICPNGFAVSVVICIHRCVPFMHRYWLGNHCKILCPYMSLKGLLYETYIST